MDISPVPVSPLRGLPWLPNTQETTVTSFLSLFSHFLYANQPPPTFKQETGPPLVLSCSLLCACHKMFWSALPNHTESLPGLSAAGAARHLLDVGSFALSQGDGQREPAGRRALGAGLRWALVPCSLHPTTGCPDLTHTSPPARATQFCDGEMGAGCRAHGDNTGQSQDG